MNIVKAAYCRTFQAALRAALPFLPYRKPEIIGSVWGLPDIIKKKKCSHPLIITDKPIHELGLLDRLEQALTEAGLTYDIYDGTVPNPTTANVAEALEIYKSSACDCLIGFGGGSSMDCAKGVGISVVRPGVALGKMEGILKVIKRLPLLIAIPTTAGTGSETTLAAVITDADTRHKYAINDFPLIPRYAVLDPKITLSLPKHITSTTGLDALTHAVEAYIGGSTTYGTRKDAIIAVKLIFENLDQVVEHGDDVNARRNMLRASFYAGCAFTKSYVGYVHAVAHSLGGKYNVPHGLANGVLLPIVLKMYGESVYPQLKELAIAVGLAEQSTPEAFAAKAFIRAIEDMKKKYGLGNTFPELREEDIPELARLADHEANPLYPVPVLMDAKALQRIYYKVLES